jgi:hypothetical protein
VPIGAILYLDCGCRGRRMPSRPDPPRVMLIVEQPCSMHGPDGQPLMREVDPLTSASAFIRTA